MSALALAAVGGTGREAGLLMSLLAYLKTSRTNPFLSDESKVFVVVEGLRGSTYVALAADVLVAVELGGKSLQRGLNDTTTEAENQVEGRLLLNDIKSAGHSSHRSRLPPSNSFDINITPRAE